MSFRRFRRKVRCVLKHGPRGCPHIERHTRRSQKTIDRAHESALPPVGIETRGRHAAP